MPHIVDAELLAYLDGELSEGRRHELEVHLQECELCASALESLRSASSELSLALERFDRPAGEVGFEAVQERWKSRGKRRFARGSRWLKAAVLLLTLAGASAAAIPGSPVRTWIARSLQEVRTRLGGGASEEKGEAPAQLEASTVTVAAADGAIRISLLQPEPDALVRVLLVEGDAASVRSAGSRYRTGPGWIEVVGSSSSEIRIELPRSAEVARVEVDGQLAVLKEGPDLRLVLPASDTTGSELMFRLSR